jgi:hypothetical protein
MNKDTQTPPETPLTCFGRAKKFVVENKIQLALMGLGLAAMTFILGYVAPQNQKNAETTFIPLAQSALEKGETSFTYGAQENGIVIVLKRVADDKAPVGCATYRLTDPYGNNIYGAQLETIYCPHRPAKPSDKTATRTLEK